MKLKSFIVASLMLPMAFHGAQAQKANNKALLKTIDQNLSDAVAQYKVMQQQLPEGRFPKSFDSTKNQLVTSNSEWWCSGFYPGSLLYLYEQKKDTQNFNEAKRILGLLEKEKMNTGTHDLGFMMYCSFGNLYRLQPDEATKQILIQSAKSLCTRFSEKTGVIKSWNGKPNEYLVIIDNMMNLELLFWATKVTGDSSYAKIALTHANTTMKNHFHPNYASYHVVNYDANTGGIISKRTAQGFADESAWARGQAWGLYGYTVMYRETKNPIYLKQANNIAKFMLTDKHMPKDKIPYWDYNATNIPNALRDASAAAVMASALLELSTYNKKEAKNYIKVAETVLTNLSTPTYKAAPGTYGGFILKHSVGSIPHGTEIDVPLTYADYYFIEAMIRYKEMAKS
ncbi:glycosyl hydrolase family 88 [Chitinophaga skermanii]|uniref:Glycosyl hydrolase family 88 n=1 Tax=Chitinophaga skermanii TaxID=331697 RepID=A0A327QRR2_9BACT|nr:glycoside hydrolase family 88 protein [Chitinophaga skermanii]RAJ06648.1 glycosyl hydrolase family 88 [Chitinophaga skermanii]